MPFPDERQASRRTDAEPPSRPSEARLVEYGNLLAELEQLLRTHLTRFAWQLEGQLGRQEELLHQLAEGALSQPEAEPLRAPTPAEVDVLSLPQRRRHLSSEGVHGAPSPGEPDKIRKSFESSIGSSAQFLPESARGSSDESAEEYDAEESSEEEARRQGAPYNTGSMMVGGPAPGVFTAAGSANCDISKPSDALEEHMANHKHLLTPNRPNRGLLRPQAQAKDGTGRKRSSSTCESDEPKKASFESEDSAGGLGMGPSAASKAGLEHEDSSLGDSKAAGHQKSKGKQAKRTVLSFMSEEEMLRLESSRKEKDFGRTISRRSAASSLRGMKAGARHIVSLGCFEIFCCFLILSNTLLFGIEVEAMAASESGEAPMAFKVLSIIYTTLFALELLLRLLAETSTCSWAALTGWNCLDSIIVSFSLLELLLDALHSIGPGFGYVRIIRIGRIIRILRVLRVMRFVRSLRILVHSVLNTMRSLFWTVTLLVMIMYTFAVLFTQAAILYRTEGGVDGAPLVEVTEKLVSTFGSVPISVYTLFKCISNGVSWQEVADPLFRVHWFWAVLFLLYVSFTCLAVLNVVTGVFCQTAIESANHDQDMVVQEHLLSKEEYARTLEGLFRNIDSENTGEITLTQFEDRLKDPTLKAYFSAMEITIDEAWNLFKLLDTDGSHIIDIDEFVSGCLRLRGQARTVDIAMLLYQSKWTMHRITALNRAVEEVMARLRRQSAASGHSHQTSCTMFGDRHSYPKSSWRVKSANAQVISAL